MKPPEHRTDLAALDAAITRSLRIVIGAMIASLVIYLAWFWGMHARSVASEPESWGQFGDFLGGLLNPLVAFSAFYWLTRSVRLQKEELLETRRALEDSARSQEKQAAAAEESVRVAAFTALINASILEAQSLGQQVSSLTDQASRHQARAALLPDGRFIKGAELEAYFSSLTSQMEYHRAERTRYANKLKVLLGISIHGT